jgi:membrane-associated phospholipid phosphatase
MTTARPRRSWLDPDTKGGLRLTLAAAGALLVAVPFALVLLLVVDHWGPLQRLDLSVANDLNALAYRHVGYVRALRALSDIVSPADFELVSVVVAALLLLKRQPRLATWLLVTVFGGGLLSTLVKLAVDRKRPLVEHPVAHALSASFPSGHALGVLVGTGALLLVGLPLAPRRARPWLIGAGVLVVLAVGYSRLGLGVHYVSDVLGGYLLGAGWLAATTAAFTAWRRDRGHPDRAVTDGLEPATPEPERPS